MFITVLRIYVVALLIDHKMKKINSAYIFIYIYLCYL